MTRINSPTDRRLGFLNSAVMSGGIGSLICDFYLFDGPSGKTVMAMTVNPDVGLSAPDTLHPEGLYAFRFDLNGDAKEEVTFKFRFGEPRHGHGSEPTHIQPFVMRKATGRDALRGDAGESLVEGETGSVATLFGSSCVCWDCSRAICCKCRIPHCHCFLPGPALRWGRLSASAESFARRNITAIVLEVPSRRWKLLAARLCPNTLPYELGTSAAFEVATFNGRALGDDALDVMLTLVANTLIVDGLAPDRGRIRNDFPYYGASYSAEEQVGVAPMPRLVKK